VIRKEFCDTFGTSLVSITSSSGWSETESICYVRIVWHIVSAPNDR
jgi:hypothetical protein